MIPLTPGGLLRKYRSDFDGIVSFVNQQQKANRIVIERLTRAKYVVRAYRTDDIIQAVDRIGPQAMLAPLIALEKQRNDLLGLFGVFVTDDDEDGTDPRGDDVPYAP